MLVDDDPDTRAIYELFMSDFGLQVDTAMCLQEALARIEETAFDIIVTDVHLGDGLGTDLLHAVRSSQPACRTLLCSSASFPADWHERHGTLADGYLLKPVQPHHLRTALERAVGNTP